MKKIFLSIVYLVLYLNVGYSQIVYNDISPDIVTVMSSSGLGSANNIFSIDFNNDGVEEYNFRWDDWDTMWFMHFTFNNSSQIGLKGVLTNPFGGRFIQPLLFNDNIDSALLWGTSFPEPFIGESMTDTNFLGLGDSYIPVRFSINGISYYYGWVLVNFENTTNSRKLTIKSYAYNSNPNQSILAGQTSSSLEINEFVFKPEIRVYPNPVKDILNLSYNFDILKVEVYNLLGQQLKTNHEKNKDTQVDLSSLVTGTYIVKIVVEDAEYSIRIVKE